MTSEKPMTFDEALSLLRFWFDLEIENESNRNEDDEDPEYKQVLKASQIVLKEVSRSRSGHVAWVRYIQTTENLTRIQLCDSDSDGAFPVYRIN